MLTVCIRSLLFFQYIIFLILDNFTPKNCQGWGHNPACKQLIDLNLNLDNNNSSPTVKQIALWSSSLFLDSAQPALFSAQPIVRQPWSFCTFFLTLKLWNFQSLCLCLNCALWVQEQLKTKQVKLALPKNAFIADWGCAMNICLISEKHLKLSITRHYYPLLNCPILSISRHRHLHPYVLVHPKGTYKHISTVGIML